MPDEPPVRPEPDDFAARLTGAATGLGLRRSDDNAQQIDELAASWGGRVGVEGVLADLKWRLRPSLSGRLLGRAVHRAWRFDRYDQADRQWWPQGVDTCGASSLTGAGQRDVVVLTWYAKSVGTAGHGARLTFCDLATGRYRHVLLVEPVRRDGRLVLEPLHVHAGGVVWVGDWLHVAATARGFYSARTEDLVRVPRSGPGADLVSAAEWGHRYVLPVRAVWRARTDPGHERLRYSFLSHDAGTEPPTLRVGEYGRGGQSRRLARFALDPDGQLTRDDRGDVRPLEIDSRGVRQMQGLACVDGTTHLSVSRGPWRPGDLFAGRPGSFRRYPFALPMGPEDLAHRERDDTLWTVTEHPWRRWLVQVRRDWLDGRRAAPVCATLGS